MPPTISERVLEKVSELSTDLAEHLAYDKDNCKKIDGMYKILVTGNGEPPLPEVVRGHTEWIAEKKREAKLNKENRISFTKAIVLLALGQILAIAGSAFAFFMGFKK